MTPALDSGTVWTVLLVVGAGTFLLRLSFIHLAGRLPVPDRLNRALRFVPAAVLSALVAPAIIRWDPFGGTALTVEHLPRIAAGLVAAAVAWTTRGVFATLVAGMMVLWGLSYLM